MAKIGVTRKVVLGYGVVVAVMAAAVWLVYGNSATIIEVSRSSQEFMQRRAMADSLIFGLIEVDYAERAACSAGGSVESLDDAMCRLAATAGRLRATEPDTAQAMRLDSLVELLLSKRENVVLTRQALDELSRIDQRQHTIDSLGVSRKTRAATAAAGAATTTITDSMVVYDVVKSKKGFFARLADAFKPQHEDTVMRRATGSTRVDVAPIQSDTAAQEAAPARAVSQERKSLMERRRDTERSLRGLRAAGAELARSICDLLERIRLAEEETAQTVVTKHWKAQSGTIAKLIALGVIVALAAIIVVRLVRRDTKRQRDYTIGMEKAKADTERLMEQRERLLLTITHDIKAPAASIAGFIQLLQEIVDNPQAASYIESIGSSAKHLLQLVGELLNYHQLEQGAVEPHPVSFSPAELMRRCAEGFQVQAQAKGLSLKAVAGHDCEKMWMADAFRIRQIADNLIGNAIKYTDQGSVVVTAEVEAGRLVVRVADTGRGMTDQEQRQIFNAFTRLQSARGAEGVGLGLSIASKLASLLGGDIQVRSAKGEGSVFTAAIPVETAPDSAPAPGGDEARPGKKTGKMLILDDDRLQLRLVSEMIARLDGPKPEVVACSDADEALRRVDTDQPDIILMDIEMPGANGLEIIKRMRRGGATVVAMTAHDPSIEPRLIEAGFDACLFKPISRQSLARLLGLSAAESPDADSDTFRPLLEFADGDPEAEAVILDNLHEVLSGYIDNLEKAASGPDRDAIAKAAHKALPVMATIKSPCAETLRSLSPDNIAQTTDEQASRLAMDAAREMGDTLKRLHTYQSTKQKTHQHTT